MWIRASGFKGLFFGVHDSGSMLNPNPQPQTVLHVLLVPIGFCLAGLVKYT